MENAVDGLLVNIIAILFFILLCIIGMYIIIEFKKDYRMINHHHHTFLQKFFKIRKKREGYLNNFKIREI